jgi:hypothetical protein
MPAPASQPCRAQPSEGIAELVDDQGVQYPCKLPASPVPPSSVWREREARRTPWTIQIGDAFCCSFQESHRLARRTRCSSKVRTDSGYGAEQEIRTYPRLGKRTVLSSTQLSALPDWGFGAVTGIEKQPDG